MTKQQITKAALDLQPEEQLELALLLWARANFAPPSPSIELRSLIGSRVTAAKANPLESQSWDEVEAELWPKR
jgi:hypothetical protein